MWARHASITVVAIVAPFVVGTRVPPSDTPALGGPRNVRPQPKPPGANNASLDRNRIKRPLKVPHVSPDRSDLIELPNMAEAIAIAGSARGVLAPTLKLFKDAIEGSTGSGILDDNYITALRKAPLVDACEALARAMSRISRQLGSYLIPNVRKVRDSRAFAVDDEDLLTSLLTDAEVNVHKATRFKRYVENSAWMGNRWLGYLLEFYVDFFTLFLAGEDVEVCADQSYEATLETHHTFAMRTAWNTFRAYRNFPSREAFLRWMRTADAADTGSPRLTEEEAIREASALLALGGPIYRYLLRVDEIVDQLRQEERAKRRWKE